MVENPWLDLPSEAPYVLACDKDLVTSFNNTAKDHIRYHIDILPEPFIGHPDSEIVLLNLNPGYVGEEEQYHHLDEYFREATLANLAHRPQQYPFYFLDPSVASPGHRWWQRKLRALILRYGHECLARHIVCLEFFPYHSARFSPKTPRVGSQDYTFDLVRRAIRRNRPILAMRSAKLWQAAVPELTGRLHRLRNYRNVAVTRNNCPTGFDLICVALDHLRSNDNARSGTSGN